MNKVTIVLSLICLLCGGMLGYSFAFGKIYQQIKKEQQASIEPNLVEEEEEATALTSENPFRNVIAEATGQRVLPLDSVCEPVLDAIAEAATTTLNSLNQADSPIAGLRRINEASRHFEDTLLEQLNNHPDLNCKIPLTREGKAQRSGYPDLMIQHQPTGRVFYLDPKLYEAGSEDSSLRTFYYTPRKETSKILKSGHHLLIGFSHDGKDGKWTFQSWKLVDLSQTTLKLKSEYNASNRELYKESITVRKSE